MALDQSRGGAVPEAALEPGGVDQIGEDESEEARGAAGFHDSHPQDPVRTAAIVAGN